MSACSVSNPIMVDNYVSPINCAPVRLYDGPDLKLFILVGRAGAFSSAAWPSGVQLMIYRCYFPFWF